MVKIKREISKTCTEVVFISLTLYFTMNVNALKQGPPTPWPRISSSPWSVRNRAAQREVSGGRAKEASSAAPHRSHYCLNHRWHHWHYHLKHPRPLPPSVEKLSSTKPVPGAKKVGDLCSKVRDKVLWNRNRFTDTGNRPVVAKGEEGGGGME